MAGKKVCVITTVHSADDARIFHKQCRALREAGYEVVFIVPAEQSGEVAGIQVRALEKGRSRWRRILRTPLRALFLALREKAEVYHFHDPELMPVGLILKLLTGKKVIYDVHENYKKQFLNKHYLNDSLRKVVAGLVRAAELASSCFFDGIIVANEDSRSDFSNYNHICINNYPILACFQEKTNYTIGPDEILKIIYVGGVSRLRGISEIINALALANKDTKVRLTICGPYHVPDYYEEVKKLSGFQYVDYRGYVTFTHLPALMQEHHGGIVCLHPTDNYRSVYPVKLFEYMAAGLPVIASDFPLWREMVAGNRCGLCVDPLDPGEIAAAMAYLRDHPEEARQMGRHGREAVRAGYNWESESLRLLRFYEKVIRKSPR